VSYSKCNSSGATFVAQESINAQLDPFAARPQNTTQAHQHHHHGSSGGGQEQRGSASGGVPSVVGGSPGAAGRQGAGRVMVPAPHGCA